MIKIFNTLFNHTICMKTSYLYDNSFLCTNCELLEKTLKNLIFSQIRILNQNKNFTLDTQTLIKLNKKNPYLYLTANAPKILRNGVTRLESKRNKFSFIWASLFIFFIYIANNQSIQAKVSSLKQIIVSKTNFFAKFGKISGGYFSNPNQNLKRIKSTPENGDDSDKPNNNFWIILILFLLALGFIGICLFLVDFKKNYNFLSSEVHRRLGNIQFLEKSLLETKEHLMTANQSMINESEKFGEFKTGLHKILLSFRSNLDDLEESLTEIQKVFNKQIEVIMKNFKSYVSNKELAQIIETFTKEKEDYRAKLDELYLVAQAILKQLEHEFDFTPKQ